MSAALQSNLLQEGAHKLRGCANSFCGFEYSALEYPKYLSSVAAFINSKLHSERDEDSLTDYAWLQALAVASAITGFVEALPFWTGLR